MGGMMAGAFALLGIWGAFVTLLILVLAVYDFTIFMARVCG